MQKKLSNLIAIHILFIGIFHVSCLNHAKSPHILYTFDHLLVPACDPSSTHGSTHSSPRLRAPRGFLAFILGDGGMYSAAAWLIVLRKCGDFTGFHEIEVRISWDLMGFNGI
jgi:hypothetical protein